VLEHPLIVTTRPGYGTVFRVEATLSLAPARGRLANREIAEGKIRALNGSTIVVLEDNEEILNSLTRLLRSWGADTLSANSFNTSLVKKLGLRNRIDLVIADQNLGSSHITGVDASFRIREIVGCPVPVIMLTAVNGLEVVSEFQRTMQELLARSPELAPLIAHGPLDEPIVLQKPTTAAVLNATIFKALGAGAERDDAPLSPGVAAAGIERRAD
jgi:CheY-like chemotaxis protein